MDDSYPKVFISHAHEDKERFVLDFATKLRNKGVDAWVDEWEMKPGDSLVEKIYEEGIEKCDFFIIVLSDNSINKKWVKDELNSAYIQKIEKGTKIIPVLIDTNITVPKVLKHTVWIKIKRLENYKEEFNRILAQIFEYDIEGKPPLGKVPKIIKEDIYMDGFTKTDSLVLKTIGNIVYEKNEIITIISFSEIIKEVEQYDISKQDAIQSLEIMDSEGYINIQKHMGKKENYSLLTNFLGFYTYCENYINNFGNIVKETASSILNGKITVNEEIAENINCKLVVVEATLEYWDMLGYIKLQKMGSSMYSMIFNITAKGKRFLENLLD